MPKENQLRQKLRLARSNGAKGVGCLYSLQQSEEERSDVKVKVAVRDYVPALVLYLFAGSADNSPYSGPTSTFSTVDTHATK